MEQNKNGSYVTHTITETEDAGSSGIQTVFGNKETPGGFPFIVGDGSIEVKLLKDSVFRTIPVQSSFTYLPIEIKEIDWDNSTVNVIDHFGR